MLDADAVEKQLKADLETLRAYRELEARYAPRTTPSLPAAGPLRTPTQKGRTQGSNSVAALSLQAVGADWLTVTDLFKLVSETKPKASRSSVVTALNRFVQAGRIERREDTEPAEYRRKAG